MCVCVCVCVCVYVSRSCLLAGEVLSRDSNFSWSKLWEKTLTAIPDDEPDIRGLHIGLNEQVSGSATCVSAGRGVFLSSPEKDSAEIGGEPLNIGYAKLNCLQWEQVYVCTIVVACVAGTAWIHKFNLNFSHETFRVSEERFETNSHTQILIFNCTYPPSILLQVKQSSI